MVAHLNYPLLKNNETHKIALRPGKTEDTYAVFKVFVESLFDLNYRSGHRDDNRPPSSEELAHMWQDFSSLYKHLEHAGDFFWVAEQDGQIIGYARSTLRDGLLELTELFVSPSAQAKGVGRRLLARTFPGTKADQRLIIATLDLPAQACYLKEGVYPHCPIYTFGGEPKPIALDTDLDFQSISVSPETLEILASLDKTVLGHRRDIDHKWLLSNRQGYLYLRDKDPVGYGYIGRFNGPFVLLYPEDFPAVLAHLESESVGKGHDFGIDIPMVNRTAVDHMLKRGFHFSPFIAMIMVDQTNAKFENYIATSPPFFI